MKIIVPKCKPFQSVSRTRLWELAKLANPQNHEKNTTNHQKPFPKKYANLRTSLNDKCRACSRIIFPTPIPKIFAPTSLHQQWCERCLLITESPKTPGHYRYLIWVLCTNKISSSWYGWLVRLPGFPVIPVGSHYDDVRHLKILRNRTGPVWICEDMSYIASDVQTFSGGQGLGCPGTGEGGRDTNQKQHVCTKKSVTRPSNSRNPLGHVHSARSVTHLQVGHQNRVDGLF